MSQQAAFERRARSAGRKYARLQDEVEKAKRDLIGAIVAAKDEGGVTIRGLVPITGVSRSRIQQLYNVGKGLPENGVKRRRA